MTFEEKLKHSDIISSGYLEKGKDVKTTKSRIIGILLTLIIATYTVFTTIRKYQTVSETSGIGIQDQALLILSFVVIFLKVIFSFILAFYKKSIYALNHDRSYSAIQVASNIILLILFIINMYNYSVMLDLSHNWDPSLDPLANLKELSLKDKNSTFFFIVTIVINVPLILKVILFSFKHGGIFYLSFIMIPLFIIFFFKFIRNTKDEFFEFQNVSTHEDKYYLVNKRKINMKNYIRDEKLEKFFTLAVIFLIVCVSLKLSLLNSGLEEYALILICVGVCGYISNLAYFLDLRANMHLDTLSRKFDNRVEEL